MKTIIIAEAGVNHNGNLLMAKELVLEASKAGADFVKFQTFVSTLNISKYAQKANYQIENTANSEESQLDMVRKLELSFADFKDLALFCRSNNIGFLSTGFDFPSIDLLEELDVPFFKIPSGEITNKPLLRYIALKKRPVVMSTGMSSMSEIKSAMGVLADSGLKKDQITVLHCNTEYPTPMIDVNLRAMLTIGKELKVSVGYSDHTLGIEVPIAAVALGAVIIEKHFTLDRNLPGPDHKASLEPSELRAMVKSIRNIEQAISGDGKKKPSNSERKNISIARKSIVASRNISEGESFTEENITIKRPGNGINPMLWDKIIGQKANKAFKEDELIEL